MVKLNNLVLLMLAVCIKMVWAVYDITHYGAVQGQDTLSAQIANQKAFMKAVSLANSTETG